MELTAKQLRQIKETYRLSPRETQIVELIVQGVESNAAIAARLGVTPSTAQRYVHDLYAKMRVNSKLAVVLAILNTNS
jgi:DNA-binding CsgD family transcriptional regulator